MRGKKQKHMDQSSKKKHLSATRRLELLLDICLYYSGLIALVRWWTRLSGKKLVILCYHNTSGGDLRQQIHYLKRHYRILHLEAALEELYRSEKETSKARDRRTLLVLTFDDGYHDHYTYGTFLARALEAPITVFLIPGYVTSGRRFWWQEAEYLVQSTHVTETTLQGVTYHLQNPAERQALLQTIDAGLRFAQSFVQQENFLATAYKALAVPFSADRAWQKPGMYPLNWEEAREMEQSTWVSFGAHTMNHPTLANLSDTAEVQYEVSECRTELEKQLGHPVRVFAYPIGKAEHIAEQGLHAVKRAAYPWAVTSIHGVNTPRTDPHLLYRIVVDVDQHWLMVAAKTCGLWDALVHLGKMPLTLLRHTFKYTRSQK